jgi:hypothetical protein
MSCFMGKKGMTCCSSNTSIDEHRGSASPPLSFSMFDAKDAVLPLHGIVNQP